MSFPRTVKQGVVALGALLSCACGGDSGNGNQNSGGLVASGGSAGTGGSSEGGAAGQAGSSAGSAGAGGTPAGSDLTYWQDVAPILAEHCWSCHQAGGVGPNILSDYTSVRATAATIADITQLGIMPPWSVTDDGSCGTFVDSMALSDAELATLAAWATSDRAEGEPVSIVTPPLPTLGDAVGYPTPEFTPAPQGGLLAEHDEYRCFLLDSAVATPQFITGYEVVPGNAALIHHVLTFLVDPAAPSETAGVTNAEQMQALDDESPDRLGWPCFGMAGAAVQVKAVPVDWAPGQGVVSYPGNSGVPVQPGEQFVVQVHYNMHDATLIGQSDTTQVRLRFADSVERIGLFALHDPLLESLATLSPDVLAPGQESVLYTWQASLSELGLSEGTAVELAGVMPHMHGLGTKYQMRIASGGNDQCGVDVQDWDFNWQRLYFYETPIPLAADSEIQVTCDYNTSGRTDAVLPGWGTTNEMCLAVLYFTASR